MYKPAFNETYENWLLNDEDLDTFNILCTLAIFVANTVAVLYVLWSVVPFLEPLTLREDLKKLSAPLKSLTQNDINKPSPSPRLDTETDSSRSSSTIKSLIRSPQSLS